MATISQILNKKGILEVFLFSINSDLFRTLYSLEPSLIQDIYNYLSEKEFMELLEMHPLLKFDILNFLNIDNFKEEEIFELLSKGLEQQKLKEKIKPITEPVPRVVTKPRVVKKSAYDVVSIKREPTFTSMYFTQIDIDSEEEKKAKKIPLETIEEVEIYPEYNQLAEIIDSAIQSDANKSLLVKSYNKILDELLEIREYGENLIGKTLPSIEVEELKVIDKKDVNKVLEYQKLAIASLVNYIFQMLEYPKTRDFRSKWAKYFKDLKMKL